MSSSKSSLISRVSLTSLQQNSASPLLCNMEAVGLQDRLGNIWFSLFSVVVLLQQNGENPSTEARGKKNKSQQGWSPIWEALGRAGWMVAHCSESGDSSSSWGELCEPVERRNMVVMGGRAYCAFAVYTTPGIQGNHTGSRHFQLTVLVVPDLASCLLGWWGTGLDGFSSASQGGPVGCSWAIQSNIIQLISTTALGSGPFDFYFISWQ